MLILKINLLQSLHGWDWIGGIMTLTSTLTAELADAARRFTYLNAIVTFWIVAILRRSSSRSLTIEIKIVVWTLTGLWFCSVASSKSFACGHTFQIVCGLYSDKYCHWQCEKQGEKYHKSYSRVEVNCLLLPRVYIQKLSNCVITQFVVLDFLNHRIDSSSSRN